MYHFDSLLQGPFGCPKPSVIPAGARLQVQGEGQGRCFTQVIFGPGLNTRTSRGELPFGAAAVVLDS